ncbi:MAG: RNA polymerase sigma-70 factor [Bacteroidales bacterium]|nr:RNA polymerase sigma-70 factor [Bacteroidales bacterium]
MNESILIKKLRNGEEYAYEQLFKLYYEQLVLFALKMLGDYDSARELVQDLFVDLYDKRKQININTSLKSYLYRSTRNRCYNELNSKKIHLKYENYAKQHISDAEESTENVFNISEMEHAMQVAINKLPAKCKAIFMMNRFEGLSNSEIAEKLTISKRTVETQISKALKILRVELKPFLAHAGILALFILNF